jgi:hypothetical protein
MAAGLRWKSPEAFLQSKETLKPLLFKESRTNPETFTEVIIVLIGAAISAPVSIS